MPDRLSLVVVVNLALAACLLAAAAVLRLPPEWVLAAALSAALGLVFFTLASSVLDRRTRVQRVMAAVSKRSSRAHEERAAWQIGLLGMMRLLTQRVAILKDRQLEETRRLLISAGFRSRDAIVVYSFFKLTSPIVFLVGSGLYVFVRAPIGLGLAMDLAAVAAAALFGSKLPDIVVSRRRSRRLETIRRALPDTLDMLVICAEAGLGSEAALKRVVAETGRRTSALSDELNQLVLELTYLPDRRTPLENLAGRVPLSSIQAFANTLIQAERYGTPLARAFKVLSQEQRGERMLRAEEKAGRLPATMTVPMMLFILPALFIVLLGPAVLDIMDNFIGGSPDW